MTLCSSLPRLRLIALLIAALFSISAIAVASSSLVDPASASKNASAAKKKKCKKGYKKVKGKCRKAKKKATSTVSSVSLTSAHIVDQTIVDPLRISGSLAFSKAFSGNQLVEFTITGTGGTVVEKFNVSVSNATSKDFIVQRKVKITPPLTVTAKAGGKTSNTISVG